MAPFLGRHEAPLLWLFALGITAALTLALVVPGRTFNTAHVVDLAVFLDGADRVLEGQVPNRDYHSPLGPLGSWLPGLGLWLGGSFGAMMPVATLLFALPFMALATAVAQTRLPPAYALAFLAYLAVLCTAPLNPGEPPFLLSFGLYYNRWGWALLSVLLILPLPRRAGASGARFEAVAMAAIVLTAIYLKISYALLALAFVLSFLAFAHLRRPALWALALVALGVALVEFFWRGTATYLADIRLAGQASGALRLNAAGLVSEVLAALPSGLLFLAALGLAIRRRVDLRIVLVCLLAAGSGFMLLLQNAHLVKMGDIVLFAPATMVLALTPGAKVGVPLGRDALIGAILSAALLLPPTLTGLTALAFHTLEASRPVYPGDRLHAELDGLVSRGGHPATVEKVRQAFRQDRMPAQDFVEARGAVYMENLSQAEYVWTVQDGIDLLRREPLLAGKLFVFDMANPFSALLDREPPRAVDAWNHAGRTFSPIAHRAAAEFLADVDVILVPKNPWHLETRAALDQVYGPYLRQHFRPVARSDFWVGYSRRSRGGI